MKASFSIAVIATLLASPGASGMDAAPADNAAGPVIEMGDIERFYRVYDAAGGRPTAETLQRDYVDPGSEGLHQLARLRNVTGESIAQAIAKRPEIYSEARDCVGVLPRVRTRLTGALSELKNLYPEARFPAITIAIGRGRSAGVGGRETGVQIGAETLCATAWIEPDIEDRFVRVITHEFAHVQQAVAFSEMEGATVLSASLEEGAAEFVTELTTGSIAYSYMPRLTAGRESEIETAFVADIDKTDLSNWLYNSKPDAPADLGYWVGYRIVKAYYHHADDKRQALRDIFDMKDPKVFLAKSGWKPGIALD
ncbi:DUF2268 domain-containing putative Zn-dependent protease [Montanilutibacter psychrotolerans]|uniref:Lytic murein transglycosylase n=1 Tax=Montanilutibacter psychrotolerans TaxID=1327343 RepID=A0A3M8T4W3_9GAMM|nr:DUF2268 domain-containing putative Zn-dependent protease [Lysobacter psychrotolerans]RNF86240.1 lytic murein transglycosylase [Lysobacter psychrotolerans]